MLPSWSRRLPVIRTFAALREAQERLAATRDELRRTREERDFARKVNTHLISHGRYKELARAHTELSLGRSISARGHRRLPRCARC